MLLERFCDARNADVVVVGPDLHQHLADEPDIAGGFDLVGEPDTGVDSSVAPIDFRVRDP